MQAGEGELLLGLVSYEPDDREAAADGFADNVVEERGLADPGLTQENQAAASTGARLGQKLADRATLGLTTEEMHPLSLPRSD